MFLSLPGLEAAPLALVGFIPKLPQQLEKTGKSEKPRLGHNPVQFGPDSFRASFQIFLIVLDIKIEVKKRKGSEETCAGSLQVEKFEIRFPKPRTAADHIDNEVAGEQVLLKQFEV